MNVLCNSTDSINETMFKKLWSLVLKLFLNARIHWAKIAVFVAYIYCVWPDRFASHYAYIRSDDMLGNLIESTTKNVSSMSTIDCDYSDIIEENRFMYHEPYISTLLDASGIKLGGEYTPECKPKFSTAILVVYRQREEQLNAFLIYIQNFLRRQQIHYRIFIIEQYDQKPFNRAMLFNIGSVYAAKHGFPCMILHDVDLMPLNLGNLYACSKLPRHMCSSLDKFRFNLPYDGLFGGVVAIQTPIFQHINGMSNMVGIRK